MASPVPPRLLYIGGEWVAPVKGGSLPVINPATEEEFARIPNATSEDVDAAVAAATAAFKSGHWSKTTGAYRAKYLKAIATKLREHKAVLAKTETMDCGKPIDEASWDMDDVATCFDYYAGQAEALDGRNGAAPAIDVGMSEFDVRVRREALGVVGLITPWNYPLLMAAWKVAPALAAGCTAVLKPSELASLTCLELAAIAAEVGLPPGVLNVITGTGRDAGAPLSAHKGLAKVAFTGSAATGRLVAQAAAANIRPASMELGGKSALIVFEDADIEKAVEWAMFGTNGDTFGTSRRERYGDVYKTNILGAPTVMVYGEDAVRAVLAAEDRLVASDWPQVTSTLVGPDSLNLLTGPRHGAVKRALSDAFADKALRRHVPAIAELVQEYVTGWAAGPQPTAGFESCQLLSQAVFDRVVLGGAGSRDRAAQLQAIMAALQAGFNTPPVQLPFTAYGKAVAARQEFGQLVSQSIQRSRQHTAASATVTSSPSSAPAFDCAMSDVVAAAAAAAATGTALPDSLLVDNAAAAFFGNASTGPSLAKALQHLATNAAGPNAGASSSDGTGGVMAALRKEQQDIVSRHGPAITAEALDEMSYGTAVARELLRITPAVPAVFRLALVDFELQGRRIPKGWRVWCHLGDSVTRYNKDQFQPERWLGSSGSSTSTTGTAGDSAAAAASTGGAAAAGAVTAGGCPMHAGGGGAARGAQPEYSLPFGSGVRTCLGRNLVMTELLVVLAVLARGFEWEAVNPAEQWGVVPSPAPKEGLRVRLHRRP